MAAASSAHFFGLTDPQMQQQPPLQNNTATPATAAATATPPLKKKRNQPGNPSKYITLNNQLTIDRCVSIINPDPDAEVIALSPHTLMATNRFVCEVCNKGFQREQNLQLHRRGHNLPWKLKQKNPKETRRRVYLCPEPSCVHHDPSRALGDLTGIKKHFCRKHGEKKWKCDKCNKRYAVQSDWKAHSKTCGTREYRCDCGTLFSRRDSFITHRAFCDALAQDRMPIADAVVYGAAVAGMAAQQAQLQSQFHQAPADVSHSGAGANVNAAAQFDHHLMLLSPSSATPHSTSSSTSPFYLAGCGGAADDASLIHGKPSFHHHGGLMQLPDQHNNGGGILNLGYFSGGGHHQDARLVFPENRFTGSGSETGSATVFSGNMIGGGGGGFFSNQNIAPPQMSATALLQKAAQMGATTSGGGGGAAAAGSVNSLLRGFGSGGGKIDGGGGVGGLIMSGEMSSTSRSNSSQTAAAAENESQLRGMMMNTLAAATGGGGFADVDDGNLSTRDFLGVNRGGGGGGAVGIRMRHGGGMGMGSLDQEMK
uniref:Protein EARLY HEADING DATE 2 n=1 Tax=Leersia perrieri TaxID=77586 RepID=A0A0D9XAQ6_9ORYZ